MDSAEVTEIMSGPLVQWLASCLDDPKALGGYEDLVDGVFMYQVFLQIDPEPSYDDITPASGDARQRVRNLRMMFNNLKQFYEQELGHLIIKPPNITNMGQDPLAHVEEARLMLLLLLGCAVQCPIKEKFITRIKNLDLDIQLKIVDCIKQVTDKSDIVIARDTLENANRITGVSEQIQNLTQERDFYKEKLAATLENDGVKADDPNSGGLNKSLSKGECGRNQKFVAELVDWKSKLREERQRLDEQTEALLECKEELERTKASLAKVKLENSELTHAARAVQSYKDELDAITERAERADRLEHEVQRYRQKLTDLEFYKTRLEELREENRLLNENREMLEEQLRSSRRNTERVMELQAQIIEYEKIVNELSLERIADKEKFKELLEENCELHRLKKAAAEEAVLAGFEEDDDEDEPAIADNSLSEQLTNNAQARVLKLEVENRRLMAMIDSFEEDWFCTTTSKVLELQKEKNKLSLEIHSLNNDKKNLSHNFDLETLCEEALEENKKLQSILTHQRNSFERQREDCQSQRTKLMNLENSYDTIFRDKQKIQLLLESAQRRAEDLERSLELLSPKLEDFEKAQLSAKKYEAKCYELETKLTILEKERDVAIHDVRKMHEILENKDVALDRSNNHIILLEQKVAQLEGKLTNLTTEMSRLQKTENLYKDFVQISKTLESDLMAERSNERKLFRIIEKLGLNIGTLVNLSAEKIFERIGEIPQVIDCVKNTLMKEAWKQSGKKSASGVVYTEKDLQTTIDLQEREMQSMLKRIKTAEASAEQLRSENAKLHSQNVSQTSEHTKLQLINSQLAIEKEELMKNFLAKQRAHLQLVNDQAALQVLHEQFNNEYENVLQEREMLKESLRGAKTAVRKLQGTCQNLEMESSSVDLSKKTAGLDAHALQILNTEHANLQEDFTVLFASAENLKLEYKNLVGHYKKMETELNRLTEKETEMQGELNSKSEKCLTLEREISKLNRSTEMLLQTNAGLDSNRLSLMNHMSLLFSQYHELLVHSFEDKEHFRMEEKLYIDQVNHLHRQKVKLEEKIMDHYRRMDSSSTKKKKFGANLVEKVKKAGSELLSKNRGSSGEDSSKPLENSKTSESESGGNESDVSGDYHSDAVIEFGKTEILEDKICRWVIEEH